MIFRCLKDAEAERKNYEMQGWTIPTMPHSLVFFAAHVNTPIGATTHINTDSTKSYYMAQTQGYVNLWAPQPNQSGFIKTWENYFPVE